MAVKMQPPFLAAYTGYLPFGERNTAFADGKVVEVAFPRSGYLYEAEVVIAGTLTVSGTPSGYAARKHAAARLISSIELAVGNTGIAKSITGLQAFLLAALRRRATPVDTFPSDSELNTVGSYSVRLVLPVHFYNAGCAPLELGILNLKAYSEVRLRVTCGNLTDAIDTSGGSGGTFSFSGTVNFRYRPVFFEEGPAVSAGVFREQYATISVSSAGDLTHKLHAHRDHRSVLILTKAGSTPDLADTVLNSMKIQLERSTTFWELQAAEVRDLMKQTLPPVVRADGTLLDETGIYYLEFAARDPRVMPLFEGVLPGQTVSEIELIMNVNAPTGATIEVVEQYFDRAV